VRAPVYERGAMTHLGVEVGAARAAANSLRLPGDSYAAGDVVARATTDDGGRYGIVVTPGDYVVTADAGMSCEFMDASVTGGAFATVDIPCDAGIR
jgi:hypothetical protein